MKAYIKLDVSLYGVTVVIPTNDREIPGSTPGRYNLQIKITSRASLIAFIGPHQTDEDVGNTKIAPLKSQVSYLVIELFLACCLWPSHWKINTFFLSVLLSASL